MSEKPKKSKDLCSGCYHNDYNNGFMGVKECWSYKSAKVEKRLVIGTWQPPPYDKTATHWKMNCYHKKGTCYVKPDALNSEGFWKT